jgi:hypothetical protein
MARGMLNTSVLRRTVIDAASPSIALIFIV